MCVPEVNKSGNGTEPEKENKCLIFLTDCQAGGVNGRVPGLDQYLHIAVHKEANKNLIEDQIKQCDGPVMPLLAELCQHEGQHCVVNLY